MAKMKRVGPCLCIAWLVLAGCGTIDTHKTVEQLTNARVAVESAEKMQAQNFAPNEMRYAQDALAIARDAYAGQAFERAFEFAKKATIYALMAKARTQQKSAEQKLAEDKNKLERLKHQTDELIKTNPADTVVTTITAQGMVTGITPAAAGGTQP